MPRIGIVVVAVMLFAPVVCFGFDANVGIKLGAGYPFFSGQDYKNSLDAATVLSGVDAYGASFSTRFSLGFSGGLYATVGLFNFIALQPEAIFSTGGGTVGYPENYFLYSYRESYKVSMIEVPVLLKIRFGYRKGSKGKPSRYVMAGPGMAFRLGDGKVVTKVDGEKYSSMSLPGDYFARNYTFFVIGAGFEGIENFLDCVELRYHMGLTSVLDERYNLDEYRENNIQLLLGFKFRSGSR